MFIFSQDKRPIVENAQRISVSVFVRKFYLELKKKATNSRKVNINLNDEEFVKDLIEMIESGSTINLKQELNGKIEFTEQNQVRITYNKSNLGKGYIFWFICGVCGRKVRYLYIPPNSQVSACRTCHRLAYNQHNSNERCRSPNRLFR